MGTAIFLLILILAILQYIFLLDLLLAFSNFGFFVFLPPALNTFFLYLSSWSLYWFVLYSICILYIAVVGAFRNRTVAFMILYQDTRETLSDFMQVSTSPDGIVLVLGLTLIFPILSVSMFGIFFSLFAFNNYPYHRGAPCSSWPRMYC